MTDDDRSKTQPDLTDQDIERYVSLVCGLMRLRGKQRAELSLELRDHLTLAMEQLEQKGVDHDDAVRRALEEFGDAQALAASLAAVAYYRKKRWMMRVTIGSLTGLAGLLLALTFLPTNDSSTALSPISQATAQNETSPPKPETPPVEAIASAEEERLLGLLKKKGRLDFFEQPLKDVVAQLAEIFEAPLFLDTVALADIGITRDTPVTFAQDMSFGAALRHICRQFDLAYVPYESQLLITSPERYETIQTTRFQPVWDLVTDPLNQAGEADYDSLVELITATISPETWEDLGGSGTVLGYKGLLVCTQTLEVQTRIANLLRELHKLPPLGTGPQGVPPTSIRIESDEGWRAPIETKLTAKAELDIFETPLSEVANDLRLQHGFPVLLDTRALEDVGITADTPVTISLSEVPLRSALRLLLQPLGLTFVVRDEALVITSVEQSESNITTRIYPVTGLLEYDTAQELSDLKDEYDELIELIISSVNNDSWDSLGGFATISAFPNRGCLVISQIDDGHRKIQSFLKTLYRARRSPNVEPKQPPPNPEEVVMRIYRLLPFDVRTDEQGNQMAVGSDMSLDGSAAESLIRSYVEPDSWQNSDVSLRLVAGRIIVVHKRRVHSEIVRLLRKLSVPFTDDAGNRSGPGHDGQHGFGGGGFF